MSEPALRPVPKYWRQPRPPRWLPRAALIVAVILVGVKVSWGILTQLKDLFVILLAALFVAFAIEPGVDFLARHGIRRGAGTGLIYLAIVLAFAGDGLPHGRPHRRPGRPAGQVAAGHLHLAGDLPARQAAPEPAGRAATS